MNKLLNDIKELPEFYKALAILLAALSYIFVPPLLNDVGYIQAMAEWAPIALSCFVVCLFVWCLIGKRIEESGNES